jgi:hypothetical protein
LQTVIYNILAKSICIEEINKANAQYPQVLEIQALPLPNVMLYYGTKSVNENYRKY